MEILTREISQKQKNKSARSKRQESNPEKLKRL